MTLMEQLDNWFEDDEFQNMVNAIQRIPKEDWDFELIHYLACAWNNLEEYDKTIALLQEKIAEEDREYRWHYKMGYAYYYLDRMEEALEEFEKALELCPGDEDTLEFIRDCKDILETDEETEGDNEKEGKDGFLGFVVLSSPEWDKEKLKSDLKNDWSIICEEEGEEKNEILFSTVEGGTLVAALMEMPIPEGEVEWAAEKNYMWSEAVETARSHKAHLMVTVMGGEDIFETGKLFVKLASCCCRQENALGIYVNKTFLQPQLYMGFAEMMKGDELPIFNWVWFGLYRGEHGMCGYTQGLEVFGKEEIEILDAEIEPRELQEFMMDIAVYILSEDVVLRDGETIGFTEEQKLPITRSEGVAVEGMSLKITF